MRSALQVSRCAEGLGIFKGLEVNAEVSGVHLEHQQVSLWLGWTYDGKGVQTIYFGIALEVPIFESLHARDWWRLRVWSLVVHRGLDFDLRLVSLSRSV